MKRSRTPIESSASSSSVEAFLYDPTTLTAQEWQPLRLLLWAAIDRSNGEADPDATLIDVVRGRAQLWGVRKHEEIQGVVVTKVLRFPSGKKTLLIELAAGNDLTFDEMRGIMGRLEHYGRVMECEAVRIYGRQGWAKVLEGYGQPFTVLEKELG
jgi:hypothetical protein